MITVLYWVMITAIVLGHDNCIVLGHDNCIVLS